MDSYIDRRVCHTYGCQAIDHFWRGEHRAYVPMSEMLAFAYEQATRRMERHLEIRLLEPEIPRSAFKPNLI